MLSDHEKQLYARHLLLLEIGERGQEKLCAAQVAMAQLGDARASAVAREYLQRGGTSCAAAVSGGTQVELALPDASAVDALAGDPRLQHAAAWLAGSFAAVEAIKQIVGVGRAGAIPETFSLSSEVG
ncbi:MAG TPA: hypothetical protein VF331_18650 [Polyangiales bacterium]